MMVPIQDILAMLWQGLALNYGLDWGTMFFGVLGGYLMTKKDRRGILFNMIACFASFTLALLSHQYGFLVYNVLTLAIMVRGYLEWTTGKNLSPSRQES